MAPTQPRPSAPPDTCKNRRLGWLHQPSFNAWQSDTTGRWVDGANPAYAPARPGPCRSRLALRKLAAVIALPPSRCRVRIGSAPSPPATSRPSRTEEPRLGHACVGSVKPCWSTYLNNKNKQLQHKT